MRLVADKPEKHASEHRPAIDQQQRAAEQRRGEKGILTQSHGPEYGGESEERQQRAPARRLDDAARNQQAEQHAQRLEGKEGGQIRQAAEESAEQQVNRRVVEEIVFDAGLRRLLLGGVMRRLVISETGRAGIGEAAGRIKAHEIGGRRPLERDDPAMRAGDKKKENGNLEREQHAAK